MSSYGYTGVFGAYLLAVYDDESECYQTISKLGTGFSEEQLVQLADSLRPAIIPAPRSYYQVGEGVAVQQYASLLQGLHCSLWYSCCMDVLVKVVCCDKVQLLLVPSFPADLCVVWLTHSMVSLVLLMSGLNPHKCGR